MDDRDSESMSHNDSLSDDDNDTDATSCNRHKEILIHNYTSWHRYLGGNIHIIIVKTLLISQLKAYVNYCSTFNQ